MGLQLKYILCPLGMWLNIRAIFMQRKCHSSPYSLTLIPHVSFAHSSQSLSPLVSSTSGSPSRQRRHAKGSPDCLNGLLNCESYDPQVGSQVVGFTGGPGTFTIVAKRNVFLVKLYFLMSGEGVY